jgi:hypothetical protein
MCCMYRPPRPRIEKAVLVLALAFIARASAQDLPQSPDYSQPPVADAAARADAAWKSWMRGDRDLEREVFKLPMGEARDRLQHSLSAFLAYLEARKAYADKVAA